MSWQTLRKSLSPSAFWSPMLWGGLLALACSWPWSLLAQESSFGGSGSAMTAPPGGYLGYPPAAPAYGPGAVGASPANYAQPPTYAPPAGPPPGALSDGVYAQTDPSNVFRPRSSNAFLSDQVTGQSSGEALGVLARIGEQTGPSVGRRVSITTAEIMPYTFIDDLMLFTDFRGFRGSNAKYGVNIGAGARYYISRWDRIIGGYGYYDYDGLTGNFYHQLTTGIETYGPLWDGRANFYLPSGNRRQLESVSVVPGSAAFVAHNLQFGIQRTFGVALTGGEVEFGTPIPGPLPEAWDMRAYAGGYGYSGPGLDTFYGWRGRLQASPIPSLNLGLDVMQDKVFHTNVMFTVNLAYGGYKQADGERKSTFSRMTTPVQRAYQVNIADVTTIENGVVATNPATGTPYVFEHVFSGAVGPIFDGTVENPFKTIPDAQAVPVKDIIFVHANSVFNGTILPTDNSIVTQPNVRILGESANVNYSVAVPNVGFVQLPHVTAGAALRPEILNSPGDAVTFASNSEFSGFQIGLPRGAETTVPAIPLQGPVGNGFLIGPGISNVVANFNEINFAGQNGIRINNGGSNIAFLNTRIYNPTNAVAGNSGLLITGGSPIVKFLGDSAVDGDVVQGGGPALQVLNTLAGTVVDTSTADFRAVNTLAAAPAAFNFTGDLGQITIGALTIDNDNSVGIRIDNSGGRFVFVDSIDVNRGNGANNNTPGTFIVGDAIQISNQTAGGSVLFNNLAAPININGRQGRGLNVINDAGTIVFNAPLTLGSPSIAGSAVGIDFQHNSGSLTLTDVTIRGSGADGIDIGGAAGTPNTGSFQVLGTTTITNGTSAGGARLPIVGNAIAMRNDSATVSFRGGVIINSRQQDGILVQNMSPPAGVPLLPIAFSTVTISNPDNSVLPAFSIVNNNAATNVSVGATNISGATSGGANTYGAGVDIQNDPGQIRFTSLTASGANGTMLFVRNAGTVAARTGGLQILTAQNTTSTLTSTLLPTVDIQNSVLNTVNLTAVNDTASASNGINLVNNVGAVAPTAGIKNPFIFSILGTNGNGGTISTSALNGVQITNTESVLLQGMTLNTNTGNGILINDTNRYLSSRLQLTNNRISNNGADGLFGTNVQYIDVVAQTTGNPPVGFNRFSNNIGNAIFLQMTSHDSQTTALDDQVWNITDNTFTNTASVADTIGISTGVGAGTLGAGSSATVNILRNTITQTNGTAAGLLNAVNINWDGNMNAFVNGNQFTTLNGRNTAISYTHQDTNPPPVGSINNVYSFTSTLNANNNTITGNTGQNTGISVTTNHSQNADFDILNIANNTVTFTGGNVVVVGVNTVSNGLLFNLDSNFRANVNFNQINLRDTANDNANQGIHFVQINTPGTLNLGGNTVTITSPQVVESETGIGIDALTVISSARLNLSSVSDNVVTFNGNSGNVNDTNLGVLNFNNTNGSILVNGVAFP